MLAAGGTMITNLSSAYVRERAKLNGSRQSHSVMMQREWAKSVIGRTGGPASQNVWRCGHEDDQQVPRRCRCSCGGHRWRGGACSRAILFRVRRARGGGGWGGGGG